MRQIWRKWNPYATEPLVPRPVERPKRVAVLGCGPAGLFAAHALVDLGHEVKIFSRKRKSEMFGAQYLHAAIPGLTDGMAPITLKYKLIGTIEGYQEKVYGPGSAVKVSPETLEENHQAWDIRQAYGRAWNLYADLIQDFPAIDSTAVRVAANHWDLIVSSIPAPAICESEDHHFHSQDVWAIGDAPERGIFNPVLAASGGEVILNGDRDTGWYRNANVFFHGTTEWPGGRKPPIANVAPVSKPLSNDCDCHPEVLRVGRYGRWTKGVLSHEAYYDCLGVR